MLSIPRIHHTIWVGPLEPPMAWIDSWKEHNTDWLHVIWNEKAIERHHWRNQRLIDHYMESKQWPGVADVCRAEILLEYGGFIPGADSRCLRPIDDLFKDPLYNAYVSYENEVMRGNLKTPLLACSAGNVWAELYVKELGRLEYLGEPWQTTGNRLVTHLVDVHDIPGIKVWPSHYLIPNHYTGQKYTGDELPYAEHMWGTTLQAYKYANL